ncbi:hypothetical protein [[Clostridium] colinum]|uniref:hypothetical protein n=1 Tax=[Clostridium] colinum TaxID=36835 RepID=UPI002024102D|nr:hypothetical protein [[Clostridium] colinum]
MKEQLEFIGIKIPKNKKEQLEKYANKYYNGNISMAIREFINKGLAINSYKDEIDFLREMINEEIENSLNPYMNRLIAISSKGAIMSASSHFALGETLNKLVDPIYRKTLEQALIESKKKGYAYITSKDENLK